MKNNGELPAPPLPHASLKEVIAYGKGISASTNNARPMTVIMNGARRDGSRGWVIRWGTPNVNVTDPSEHCGSKFDCEVCGHKCRVYEMELEFWRAFGEQHPELISKHLEYGGKIHNGN